MKNLLLIAMMGLLSSCNHGTATHGDKCYKLTLTDIGTNNTTIVEVKNYQNYTAGIFDVVYRDGSRGYINIAHAAMKIEHCE
jgi:hypothetical protein